MLGSFLSQVEGPRGQVTKGSLRGPRETLSGPESKFLRAALFNRVQVFMQIDTISLESFS